MTLIQKGKEKIAKGKQKIKELTKKQKIVILVVVLVFFAIIALSPKTEIPEKDVSPIRAVSLISVRQTSTESTPLEVTGQVRSESEALLRTERQGEVVGVYATVGQFVSAGTVLAELKNTSERAAVDQAKAGLETAEAALLKGTGGVRDEDLNVLQISFENAQNSFNSAKTNSINTLRAAYASVDDAVIGSVDSLFSNPDGINPVFNLITSESVVVNRLKQNRILLQNVLERQTSASLNLTSNGDLLSEIETTESEVQIVRALLDDTLLAINSAIPSPAVPESMIAGFKISVTSSRLAINRTLSSLSGARDLLNNSQAALDIASQNLERGTTGAQAEDVTALEASVKQAEASLSLARANLARTLIVTPISGTLNTMTLRKGDFVNVFEVAAIVSNNNAFEVETFITADDKDQIRVGSEAIVSQRYEAVVTSVAPGLDSATKKIEVRIGLLDESTTLTHGSSVRVEIERNGFEIMDTEIERISIPISALKIETSRVIVFTVDNNVLVANEVTPGIILGDNIVITAGLTLDMNIVGDARGLREGQEITITN